MIFSKVVAHEPNKVSTSPLSVIQNTFDHVWIGQIDILGFMISNFNNVLVKRQTQI